MFKKLLKEVKDMKFLSKEQAVNYMKNINLPQKDIDWILKKL